jgi:hypothetical protein
VGEATDGDADHAHTGEALVAVRRYRRKRTSGGAPLSVTVVPNNPLAAQAAEWSTALSMANARAGLEKLAAGHSQWFIEEFAPSMLRQADTPDETAYWQSLIDATREHIEDDKLAAEVAAGTKQFEDVAEQLRRRMAAAGKESPEYPDLLEKLNQVTDARSTPRRRSCRRTTTAPPTSPRSRDSRRVRARRRRRWPSQVRSRISRRRSRTRRPRCA